MPRQDAQYRSDRALYFALAVFCATISAALGAALTYRPAAIPISAVHIETEEEQMLANLAAEHRCLTEALYYEARGEGPTGQKAVAEVVFHRMQAGRYGRSICAVVYEGSSRPGCQFSFTCNGDLGRPREKAAWLQSEELAAQILTGAVTLRNTTGGAINYHAVWVRPDWAPTLRRTTQIGNHIFYRGPHRES
jgi:spore germination cell wall hydrolase CwlJ-like protein